MEKDKVKAWYDKSVDIFYLLFQEGPSYEVIEADPDVHLELDEKGKIIGIEIWNARKSGLIKQMAKAIAETTHETTASSNWERDSQKVKCTKDFLKKNEVLNRYFSLRHLNLLGFCFPLL